MFHYEIGEDFTNVIERSLPDGEHTQAISGCFTVNSNTKVVNGRVVTTRFVDAIMHIALTNTAVRFIGFKTVKGLSDKQEEKRAQFVAKGLSDQVAMRKVMRWLGATTPVPIPEIASSLSYQVADISSILFQEVTPADFVRKRFGPHTDQIGVLSFSCRGESVTVNSIYENFRSVYRQLDASKSGAAIASTITSVDSALRHLVELLNEGVLTQDEFDQAKNAFVGKANDVPESAATSLRQLHSLFIGGILSEAEYRAKKFDVLASSSTG